MASARPRRREIQVDCSGVTSADCEHSIRGDARRLDRDRTPLALRHPAALTAKSETLTYGPRRPGLRVDRRELHNAVADRARSIKIDCRDFMVEHLAPPGVPLTEPLPYGTAGAEFQRNCGIRHPVVSIDELLRAPQSPALIAGASWSSMASACCSSSTRTPSMIWSLRFARSAAAKAGSRR
jgi:hypothetical protein